MLSLPTLTENRFLMRVIIRIGFNKFRELPGARNRDTEEVEQEQTEPAQLILSFERQRHFNLSIASLFRDTVDHFLSSQLKSLPHCDQLGDSISKVIREVMQPILRCLRCRKRGMTNLGEEPIELTSPDKRACSGDCRVIKNFYHRTNSRWKHGDFKREEASKNSSHPLPVGN